MKLYQAFEVDEETPVQWLAVHPLRWKPEWGEPKIMFREMDDDTQRLADVGAAMLEVCKEIVRAVSDTKIAVPVRVQVLAEKAQRAIAQAEGDQ